MCSVKHVNISIGMVGGDSPNKTYNQEYFVVMSSSRFSYVGARAYAGGLGVQPPPIGLSTKMHNKENITFLALLSLFFVMTRTPT